MHVQVTKIDNGYLVTKHADDGTVNGTKAVLKNLTGGVPTGLLGRAITNALGKIIVTKKATRKARTPKATVAVA